MWGVTCSNPHLGLVAYTKDLGLMFMVRDSLNYARAARRAWLEAVLLTVAAPLLGRLANERDPFQLDAAFPWLAFAPLLVGLQHGLLRALFSSSLLTALAYAHTQTLTPQQAPALVSFAAGCFAIAALSGQFRDSAKRSSSELRSSGGELEEQLERLSRAHSALKLSHARLEERLAAERWSLEACLEHAARSLESASSPRAQAQVVLDVLATHALVQGAALYLVDAGALQRFPVAVLGQPSGLVFAHPLMKRALETKRLVALSGGEPSAGDGRVLAAVPLVAASGELRALIAIHQMPFMAFHAEQLEKLATICARLADLLDLRIRHGQPLRAMRVPQTTAQLEQRERTDSDAAPPHRPSRPVAVS
jgi:hypothetical protein